MRIRFVSYGPCFHYPTVWPCVWEAAIPHYNFWLMTKGAGRLECRGKEYQLEPGTCFLFTPGTKVRATYNEGIKMASFAAHFFPLPEQRIPYRHLDPIFGRSTTRLALFHELSIEAASAFKRGDPLGHQQAEWALLTMMSHLWREAHQLPHATQNEKIIEILQQVAHGSKRTANIPDLAHKVQLSASQFTRRVQEITGGSPNDYIIRERIRYACFLLMETSKSVKMVAADLGYSDASFFVRQFRKIMGVAPHQYQQTKRQAVVKKPPKSASVPSSTAAPKRPRTKKKSAKPIRSHVRRPIARAAKTQ